LGFNFSPYSLNLERAFDEWRKAMVRAPVLALPNATDPFILDTDASDKSVGAELIQIQEGVLLTI
jgi:hypothetical protein